MNVDAHLKPLSRARILHHASHALRHGSKSFAAAAALFPRDTRHSVRMLYAWCRHCDDVIDNQSLGHARSPAFSTPTCSTLAAPALAAPALAAPALALDQLARLECETRAAFTDAALPHPVFAALQEVARAHRLPLRLALDHLEGHRMDVQGRRYETLADVLDYCYHVAGVVGLMVATIVGVTDPATLDRACDLGIAFQLTNIARDVIDDAAIGRFYLPRVWLAEAGLLQTNMADPACRAALATLVSRLLDEAERYYRSARIGIAALPWRSGWAIANAHAIYRAIGLEIIRRGPAAWDQRVTTTRARKLLLALGAGMALANGRRPPAASRTGLWTRPDR